MSWLNWTMIANAQDAKSRVEALLYLLRDRYQLDAASAGSKLRCDYSGSYSLQQLLSEVRAALQTEGGSITSGTWCSDADAQQYLIEMLAEYDMSSSISGSNECT